MLMEISSSADIERLPYAKETFLNSMLPLETLSSEAFGLFFISTVLSIISNTLRPAATPSCKTTGKLATDLSGW